MAFWGIELKPGKPFRQIPTEGTGSQLHITNAVLGLNPKKGERTVVKCKVGENPEIFLASLTGGSVEACVLDIIIADDVIFSVIGSTSVHLTGYYMPMEPQEMSEDEFDEYGEEEYDSEDDSDDYDEYEEGDEDEDDDEDESEEDEEDEGVIHHGNKGASEQEAKALPMRMHIEEITDDAAAGALPVIRANPIVTETLEEYDSDEEDEDGFERHHKRRAHTIQVQEPSAKKQAVEEAPEAEASQKANGGAKSTPKAEKTKPAAKTPVAEKTPVSEEGGKKGKKQKGEKTPGTEKTAGNGSEKKRKGEKTPEGKAVNGAEGVTTEKKRKGENGVSVSDKKSVTSQEKKPIETSAVEEKRVDGGGKKKQADTPLEEGKSPKAGKGGKGTVREFPNGLKIEELGMGRPDGKRAEKGKKIFMQYVGKLAKNGKVFDASRGKPFAFRLGVGEVISGWDKGVEGMRVGDKRRLTIPPSMGYGARGAPPDIPGNATLVFDIELVNVK